MRPPDAPKPRVGGREASGETVGFGWSTTSAESSALARAGAIAADLKSIRSRRRLPPFARELVRLRRAGFIRVGVLAHVTIHTGPEAWRRAKRAVGIALVLPEGESPAQYNWTAISDLDVAVVYDHRDAELLPALIDELLACNPKRLFSVCLDALPGTTAGAFWKTAQ